MIPSYPILEVRQGCLDEFVRFWEKLYSGYDEKFYEDNKGKELDKDRISEWFKWKNGMPLSPLKAQSISHYSSADERIRHDANDDELARFLRRPGGTIWRIFWLHIQHPDTFPIYDQHVHRAMAFMIGSPIPVEIPPDKPDAGKPDKVKCYLATYRPFVEQFAGFTLRQIDRALMTFGQFLKSDYGCLITGRPKSSRKPKKKLARSLIDDDDDDE